MGVLIIAMTRDEASVFLFKNPCLLYWLILVVTCFLFCFQGKNILLAQYIFAFLYVLNLGLVFRILGKFRKYIAAYQRSNDGQS